MKNHKVYAYILIGILAFLVTLCFNRYYKNHGLFFLPEVNAQLLVKGTSDRNEFWMAQTPDTLKYYDLSGNFAYEQSGVWEYRKADQYGYSCDFIVSYSDDSNNISSCKFKLPAVENCSLVFWKNIHGAPIELIVDGKSVCYDLYSNTEGGELMVINPFALSTRGKAYKALILGIVYLLAYLLIYLCYKDKDRYLNSILVYGKESSLEDGRWEEVTGEKTERNSFIDVAKGIGIILVIIGHAGIPGGVHRVIYSFHMALFFIISGYLFNEKKWVGKLKFIEYTKKRARKYLLPYFVLAIINFVILGTIWGYTQAATVAEYINVLKGYIFGTIYSISGLMPLWAPIWYLTCIFVASIIFFVVMQLRDDLKGIVVACCGVFSWYCYRHLGFRLPWNMSPAGIGVVMM